MTSEIIRALKLSSLVASLGWHDIRGRYRRSAIGPFWLTISMGVMIASIGLVFGQLFKTPMADYLPHLTLGLILWTFITGAINDGCSGFIDAEVMIKQLPIPLFVHILRAIWRNLLIFIHNIAIVPVVFFVLNKGIGIEAFLIIPGLILVSVCLSWIALLFALVCTRYRDVSQIVASVLQVAFHLTPIIWMPSLLPERMAGILLQLNPFYHLIELIRAPFLGAVPGLVSYLIVLGMIILGWGLTLIVFSKLRYRVAYWL